MNGSLVVWCNLPICPPDSAHPPETTSQAASTTSFTGAFNAQQRAAVAASAGQALTLAKSLRVETVETLKVWI